MSDISNEAAEVGRLPLPATTASRPNEACAAIKQDAAVYLLVGGYSVAVGALSIYLNDEKNYHPFQYVLPWMLFSVPCLALIWAVRSIRLAPTRPFSTFVATFRAHRQEGAIWRLPLMLAIAIFYGVFTSAKNMLPEIRPFSWDGTLAALDYHMLGGHDGWKLIAHVTPQGSLALLVLDLVYTKIWLFMMMGFCAYVSLSPNFSYVRRQFLTAFILGWIIAGNILAVLFMSVGPCFYGDFNPDHLRFAGLLQSVVGTGAEWEQTYLRNAFLSGHASLASGISAFPSVHLVTIVVLTLLLKKIDLRLFWIGIILSVLMELGSVRFGWHYVSDGLVGTSIAIFSWYLAKWILPRDRTFA